MIKGAIAIAALLNLVDANTLGQLSRQQGTNQHDDMSQLQQSQDQESQDLQWDAIQDLEDHLIKGEETQEIQLQNDVEASSTKMAAGCDNGIKRWSDAGNSWKTFQDAHTTKTKKFVDTTFKTDDSSLFDKKYLKSQGNVPKLQRAKTWGRPTQMQQGAPSLWGPKGYPVPNGIKQGSLGDCWFLAAASAVAEVPQRMQRAIWNNEYDKNGAFRFYFWVKDKWHGINIDDQLPANKYGNNYYTVFTSKSELGAWWMPLLEKAYAKLDQNYERIISGNGLEALRTLTGMPTTYVSTKSMKVDDAYKLVQNLASKNHPMTTSCCNHGSFSGLVTGHAYTLLDVKELSNGVKLAKVRNPWSRGEWIGDWSDTSSMWTDALRKEAGHAENDKDGSFFMTFKDYHRNFRGFSVSLYQDYEGYQVINAVQKEYQVAYKITNPADQEMYIVGETMSNRNYPRTCDPKNNYVMYLVDGTGKQLGQFQYIGHYGFALVGPLGQKLPKGDYKLEVINRNYKTKAANISLNFYWADKQGVAARR